MRVALITSGSYPYRPGAIGTWCHRLVRGLPEHAFHLLTVVDQEPSAAAYLPPTNTLTVTPVPTSGPPSGPLRGRAALNHRRFATHAAVLLCRGMLDDTPRSLAMFRSSLRRLATSGATGTHPLHGVPLAAVLADAWQAAGWAARRTVGPEVPGPTPPRAALPAPGPRDPQDAAALLEALVRPLAAPLPVVELFHAADGALGALVAIGAKWRTGVPFVLTEHQSYLDAPLLDATEGRPAVRAVLLRFLRALARLAYAEAARVVAPTEALRRWAVEHGADKQRSALVPYGVDPHTCPVLRGEPVEPAVTFLGPEPDVDTMFAALPRLRATHRELRLVVAGPAREGGDEQVSFLGPVSHRRSAYATGQVVVLSARDKAMPYALIEAMMCGRPVICVDDGSLAPIAGMGAVIVPPGDPDALARQCLCLLGTDDGARGRRRALGSAAAQRARNLFGLRMTVDRFRELYEEAARDTAAPTERLVPLRALTADLA